MNPDNFRHLRPSDYRVMPWRNGGGTTTELFIDPDGSSLDTGFRLRLSMAEVGVSGPFSRFEGCDRTLLLLEGRGLRLEFDQRGPVRLDQLLDPVAFSGDWLTSGTLLDGPCRDFNVITRRAQCWHRLEVLNLDAHPRPILQAGLRFVFCAEGRAQLDRFTLSTCELLRIESGVTLEASSPGLTGAVIIAVGIDRSEG